MKKNITIYKPINYTGENPTSIKEYKKVGSYEFDFKGNKNEFDQVYDSFNELNRTDKKTPAISKNTILEIDGQPMLCNMVGWETADWIFNN